MSVKTTQNENEDERTLIEILRNPEITKAINKVIDTWSTNQPGEMGYKFRMLHLSYLFSGVVLLTIASLGWQGVISKEVTAGLIGTLIGYWYGRSREK